MYDYHGTDIHTERLAAGRDHCDTPGPVYDLVLLVSDGRITDPERGGDLTTSSARQLIYAVDADLSVHVGFDSERGISGAVKHETLFHNEPVEAAGEMEVVDGIVVAVNDRSGSYGTTGQMRVDPRMARTLLAALRRANVRVADAVLDFLNERAGV